MVDLHRMGEQLATTLAEIIADIEARERALAGAMELSTETGSVRAAFNQGQASREAQILALIDEQLQQLQRANLSPLALQTLKRKIQNDP